MHASGRDPSTILDIVEIFRLFPLRSAGDPFISSLLAKVNDCLGALGGRCGAAKALADLRIARGDVNATAFLPQRQHLFREQGVGKYRLDLRSKYEPRPVVRVMQDPHAEGVPCAEKALFCSVPDREGEIAHQMVYATASPPLEAPQDQLGVAGSRTGFQGVDELLTIVKTPIAGDRTQAQRNGLVLLGVL